MDVDVGLDDSSGRHKTGGVVAAVEIYGAVAVELQTKMAAFAQVSQRMRCIMACNGNLQRSNGE